MPGVAHFTEHLLFLGTERFPDEAEYKRFLAAHGGHSNASTATETTCFHFDVLAEHLDGALDRFAQPVMRLQRCSEPASQPAPFAAAPREPLVGGTYAPSVPASRRLVAPGPHPQRLHHCDHTVPPHRFFVSPLFSEDCTQREVKAVDAEFRLKYADSNSNTRALTLAL